MLINTSKQVRSRTTAFTLIELLVVIAIICILAAILFPVFATAREKARQTTCASNEKEIALGVLQYTQDYDDMIPIVTSQNCVTITSITYTPFNQQTNVPCASGVMSGAHWGWIECVAPYVFKHAIQGADIFNCPSDAVGQGLQIGKNTSYGMNRYLGWTPNYDPTQSSAQYPGHSSTEYAGGPCDDTNGTMHDYCGDHPYSVSQIVTPGDMVLIAEYAQALGNNVDDSVTTTPIFPPDRKTSEMRSPKPSQDPAAILVL